MNRYDKSDSLEADGPLSKVQRNFFIIGHRGASGYEAENTLNSFSVAIEQFGVDMVELDARLTKDNEIVVFHDRKTKRMTGTEGFVRKIVLKELLGCKLLRCDNFIPTLKEVLDLVDKRAWVNIEIKEGGMTDSVSNLISHYIKDLNWPAKSFNVSSFRHRELFKFKSFLPEVPISILFHKVPLDIGEYVEKFGVFSVNLWKNHVTKEIIHDIKSRNKDIKVFVYTINKSKEFYRMVSLGIDGVFTDYPDIIKCLSTRSGIFSGRDCETVEFNNSSCSVLALNLSKCKAHI